MFNVSSAGHQNVRLARLLVAAIWVFCLVVQPVRGVEAAPVDAFLVNDTVDQPDYNIGDGICEITPGEGICTLRAAVQEANARSGWDTITIGPGTYQLSLAGTDEDQAATGDLDILDDVIIQGFGPSQTIIDGGGLDRIFHVRFTATLELHDVTVRNGDQVQSGGGIFVDYSSLVVSNSLLTGNHSIFNGGAIDGYYSAVSIDNSTIYSNTADSNAGGVHNNFGTLFITDSLIEANKASVDGGGGVGSTGRMTVNRSTIKNNTTNGLGGGIYASESFTITQSTVNSNIAASHGGGIYNAAPVTRTITMTNTTISGNTAGNHGGGIYNAGTISLSSVTIAFNNAQTLTPLGTYPGGGIANTGSINIRHTLLGNNGAGKDCNQSLFSLGYNLSMDGSCAFSNTGDIINLDPKLGPLLDNAGPTPTHALGSTSPAIDAGEAAGCIGATGVGVQTDQRGFPRPVQGLVAGSLACDIGAYEYTNAALSVSKTDNQTTAIPGTTITYTLQVTNSGPSPAAGVLVTDTFPADLAGITWSCSATPGSSCLNAGGSGHIRSQVDLIVDGVAIFIARATVDSTVTGLLANSMQAAVPKGVVESYRGDNLSTDYDTLTPRADLGLDIVASTDAVNTGDTLTYTLSVNNAGPSLATNVVLTDSLPNGLVFVSASGAGWNCLDYANGEVVCRRPNLAASDSLQITTLVTAPSDAGSLVNNAEVSAATFDPNPANNAAQHSVAVDSPPMISDISDVTLRQTDPPVTITFTVTDTETTEADLVLGSSSSNQTVLPPANIVLGGSGKTRTVTIHPNPQEVGSSIVTITVSDGVMSAQDIFIVHIEPGNLIYLPRIQRGGSALTLADPISVRP